MAQQRGRGRAATQPETVTLTVRRFPAAIIRAVHREARRQGVTTRRAVIEALRSWLEQTKRRPTLAK